MPRTQMCINAAEAMKLGFTYSQKLVLMAHHGGKCAKCKEVLTRTAGHNRIYVLIGDAAHIIAESEDGPRGEAAITLEERNELDNAIYLCKNCHAEVDGDKLSYPIELLRQMREQHFHWVLSWGALDAKVQIAELYSPIIDRWESMAHLDNWSEWNQGILCDGRPKLYSATFDMLSELSSWMFSLKMPGKILELDVSFENFSHVLYEFLTYFNQNCSTFENGIYKLDRIPSPAGFDMLRYNQAALKNHFVEHLAEDIALELTRAGNLVCEQTRLKVDPTFRVAKGLLTVLYGPVGDLTGYRQVKAEYPSTLGSRPYKGIEDFKSSRANRDFHIADGISWDDPLFVKKYPQLTPFQ